MSPILIPLFIVSLGGVSLEAYTAGVGLKLDPKAKAAKGPAAAIMQAGTHDDDWSACNFHRPASGATNEQAFDLGVITKDGKGDGQGLGLAGGLELVLELLESETDLTAHDIIAAARAAAAAVGHAKCVRDGYTVGLTSGYGLQLNQFGGAAAIAEKARSSGVTPDEALEVVTAAKMGDMQDATADLVERLLDALESKARESTDVEFPSSFNIREWAETKDRPSWLPPRQIKSGSTSVSNPAWVAWKARIKKAYDNAKEIFTQGMTDAEVAKVGSRNRRVEHLALTNPATSTKDALALVWERAFETRVSKARKVRV